MRKFTSIDAEGGFLRKLPPKPKAVWIFQVSAAICFIALFVGLGRIGTLFARDSSQISMKLMLIAASWRTIALCILLLAIVGTHRRNSQGRILGLLFIAIVFFWLLYRKSVGPVEPHPWRLSYSNQQIGEISEEVTDLLTLFCIGYWFYAFGLSRRARAFFGLHDHEPKQRSRASKSLAMISTVVAGIGLLKLISLGVGQFAFFASNSIANTKLQKDAEVAMEHAKVAGQMVEAYYRKHSEYPASLTAAEVEAPLPEPVQSIRVNSVTGGIQVVMMGEGPSTSRTFFWEPAIGATGAVVWTCRSENMPASRLPKDCVPGVSGTSKR